MPNARAQDATNLLGIGERERGLDLQMKQGDIQGLLALGQAMGVLPQSGGTITPPKPMSIQDLARLAGGAGAAMTAFSDSRVKENIRLVGKEKGFNIYEFKYKGLEGRYKGVMAQEVEKIRPDAVTEVNGIKAVFYDKIGLKMEAI
jgi:hypothetical protein